MKYLPFSVYEVLGYITSGFLLIISVDCLFDCHWLIGVSLGFLKIVFWTAIALIVGHILGHLSYILYEQILIKKKWGLGYPSRTLFAEKPHKFWGKIFREYYKPLPQQIQEKINLKSDNWKDEALFLKAFSVAIQNKTSYERITNFLNQYGFCRNVSFTAFMVTLLCAGAYMRVPNSNAVVIGSFSFLVFCFLLLRFFKFYRAFSKETFVYFAFEVREQGNEE